METQKYIPPQSKFTSELDVSIPEDREEMNMRVFGRNYRRDDRNQPIKQGSTDDFAIKNGFAHADRLDQHVNAVGKSEGGAAAKRESQRIVKLNSKYTAGLARWLNWIDPSKAPKSSDI
jgi:hypothetical protein